MDEILKSNQQLHIVFKNGDSMIPGGEFLGAGNARLKSFFVLKEFVKKVEQFLNLFVQDKY
uniref:hypothetical protein n=1 Tax=Anabaena sp. 4-3 TaxID=1811979 RepID=UPI000829AD06